MAIVTKPIILDETGKGIRDALDSASASILASITDGYNKDMTLQEVVDARGEFTSLGQRLTYEKGKTSQLEQELEETLQDVKDYVDDAADKILADITDEFNIDGTLQEVVDARGDFVSLGQRLDNDDERLGVLEQTTRDLEYWKTTNNALPKVEDEGTDITLDNTADSPLTLGFKASESTQFTTTGKNKFNINQSPEINAATVTVNNNVLTQKNLTGEYYSYSSWIISNLIVGETYHINCNFVNSNQCTLRLNIYDNNNTLIDRTDNTTSASGTLSLTFTATSETIKMRLYSNNTSNPNTYTVVFSNIQLEKGNTATDYEPYTGGQPSPAPDYSQDIHVVKGDNEVVIENENLFDKNNVTVGYITSSGEYNPSTYWLISDYIKVFEQETYTYNGLNEVGNNPYSAYYDKNKNFISSFKQQVGENSIIVPTNAEYIRFSIRNGEGVFDINTFYFEKGTQATPYTEHKEQNYPLNLGVKNYLPNNITSQVKNGVTITKNSDNTLTFNGTSSAAFVIQISQITISKSGDYVLSGCPSGGGLQTYFIYNMNGTPDITDFGETKTKYLNKNEVLNMYINVRINQTFNNVTFKPQLEEGSTAHSYSPYGQTPIEMCNINNYADEFFKNVPECEYYDNTLEEGKWYKYGRIGKVILDGSEDCSNDYGTSLFTFNSYLDYAPFIVGYGLCNYYIYNSVQTGIDTNTVNGEFALQSSNGHYSIHIKNTDFTNPTDFKNWLSTHNTEVCYPLTTPTKTLLSDTLQEQLDNISYAMAYQDQTNISQVNEDRPFVISASTVLDLKTLVTNMN